MIKLQNKFNLFYIVLILVLICISVYNYYFKCYKKNDIEYIKYGLYSNQDGTEQIIIIDSICYIHRYKINSTWYSDTGNYFYLIGKGDTTSQYYYNYSNTGKVFKPIIFENFYLSDSTLYYMNIVWSKRGTNRQDRVVDMLYSPKYNPSLFGCNPTAVIAPDNNSYGAGLLYYKE